VKRVPGLKDYTIRTGVTDLDLKLYRNAKAKTRLSFCVIFGLVSDSCNELFITSNSSISTRGHEVMPINYFNAPVVSTLVNISSSSEL